MKQLPRVATPEYSVTLPSTGKKIKIRPFLAQEEKILLMALEGNSEDGVKDALKQVIDNCILTSGVNTDNISSIDVETVFLELRKRSVSETVELNFDLREMFDCGKDICPENQKVVINLNTLEIKNLGKGKKIIMLDEKVGVTLKAPSGDVEFDLKGKTEALFGIIASTINEIFDGDDVTSVDEFERDVLIEWISTSFQHKQLEEAIDFLANQPYYYKSFDVTCSKCGLTKTQEARGIVDFFI